MRYIAFAHRLRKITMMPDVRKLKLLKVTISFHMKRLILVVKRVMLPTVNT